MKKQLLNRILIYAVGVVILALGIDLTTRTGIGVLPLSAIPFGISEAFGMPFSVANFVFYVLLVAGQFLLRGKNRQWTDLLQLPFSVVFSALIGVFSVLPIYPEQWWEKALLLVIAIALNGAGVSMSVHMKLVPNPAEGLTEALSVKLGKSIGFTKNLVDMSCVVLAFLVDLIFGTLWTSVGFGTVLAMVTIGRAVALFDHFFKDRMLRAAGLAKPE